STNQACACILPTDKVNSLFIWHYLILSYNRLRNLAKGGNQPNLNVNMIKTFSVLLPPIELQNKFADFVQQVDKSKFAIQKSLDETQLLYNALMQAYFD
ncbi:MAG: restriction endonuclease subunit S, partial [Coprobacillus sp.]